MAQQNPTVARFLNNSGATVEMLSIRFSTHYLPQGRPYVSDTARDVDGFAWQCLGCGATGATGATGGANHIRSDYGRYLTNERDEARRDANAHAAQCRAMPERAEPSPRRRLFSWRTTST